MKSQTPIPLKLQPTIPNIVEIMARLGFQTFDLDSGVAILGGMTAAWQAGYETALKPSNN